MLLSVFLCLCVLLPFCEWQLLCSCIFMRIVAVPPLILLVRPAVASGEIWRRYQSGTALSFSGSLCGSRHLPRICHHGNHDARQQCWQWWQSPSREVHRRPLHPCPTTGFQRHKRPPGEGAEVFLHDPERGPRPLWTSAQLLPPPPREPGESGGSSCSHILHWSQAAEGGGGGATSGGGGPGKTTGRSQRRKARRQH